MRFVKVLAKNLSGQLIAQQQTPEELATHDQAVGSVAVPHYFDIDPAIIFL